MTKKIINVLKWARAVQDSIIAGDYNIPKEMTYAINNLQDSVYDALNDKTLKYPELPEDYVEFKNKMIKEREDKLVNYFGLRHYGKDESNT